jgi:zinc finger FYVE domain-containing protein 1
MASLASNPQQIDDTAVAAREEAPTDLSAAAVPCEKWETIPIKKLTTPPLEEMDLPKRRVSSGIKAFSLLDQAEDMCVESEEELCRLLSCHADMAIKVVSIFGNTGDGKSYTLNHTFFQGADVFETSDKQDSCTAGACAALDPISRAIIVDTEGMQAVSVNENARLRLLLKVLAISDVVIYCTKAERLHQDMFVFLEDASASYCKYFQVA